MWRRSVGIVLVTLGGIWFFQGIGVIEGSFMTDSSTWVLIGGATVIAGVALFVRSFRKRS